MQLTEIQPKRGECTEQALSRQARVQVLILTPFTSESLSFLACEMGMLAPTQGSEWDEMRTQGTPGTWEVPLCLGEKVPGERGRQDGGGRGGRCCGGADTAFLRTLVPSRSGGL